MKALVIIEVQQGMFAGPWTVCDGEAVVGRLASVLGKARSAGTPVFFVQHAGGTGEALAPDSPGFAFRPELAPREGESVTVKSHCSAFQATGLDEELRAAGVDHLVVGGMQTEFCVDTSIRSAFERDYRVTLIEDGHTTFDSKIMPGAQIVAHHNQTLGGGFARLRAASDIDFS